jgi:DNA transposition AAA+ family ATPase
MENNEQLRTRLRDLMDQQGVSLTAVAKAIGHSTATISQWLGGTYPGNVQRIDRAIESFLKRERERSDAPKHTIPFHMTSIAEKVFEIARIAHLDGEIMVIYGNAGIGKTMALKEYAEQNPDVILIRANLGFTARVLFLELSKELGTDTQGSIQDLFKNVVSKLRGSGRLIIVDEAEHLPYRALELLRTVYDEAGIGVLLAGMHKLIHNLRGKKGEYSQLYSRIGMAVPLDTLTPDDSREIVASMIPSANGLWKTFHQEAHGNARALSKLIFGTMRVARINKIESISADVVRQTARFLIA